jgi:acyl-CoA thioesterase FadM
MMTVRARIATTVLRWLAFERHRPPEVVGRLALVCWPWDCDINLHMNNSRYLALMDLGRWHHVLVSGVGREMRRRGLAPVAVHVDIDFRKSLQPFQRFTLETRIAEVGTKSVTVAQTFLLGDVVAAEAHVVVVFRDKHGTQPVAPMLEALPHMAAQAVVTSRSSRA